jgi:hypothetical protein
VQEKVLFLPVLFTATYCTLLKLCMYVCVCMCMYVCVCMYVCMFVCRYVCIFVGMWVCMYICMYVCTYVRTYVYVFVCMCVYMCVYVYIYIYIYMAKLIWNRGVIVTHTKCCILISFQMSEELFTPLSLGIQQYFLYFSRFRCLSCVNNGIACLSNKYSTLLTSTKPSCHTTWQTFLRSFVPLCFNVKYYKSTVCPSNTNYTCIKIYTCYLFRLFSWRCSGCR